MNVFSPLGHKGQDLQTKSFFYQLVYLGSSYIR